MVVIMKLPQEGRFLQKIPSAAMGPGENLHEGIFFFTFPDLRHCRITPAVSEGLHPQIAVKQNKDHPFPHDYHGYDLTNALDGTGQDKTLFRPLNPCVRIAKMELCNLDLFDFPKMSAVHDHLTPDEGIYLPPTPHIHKNDTVAPLYRQHVQRWESL